VRRLGLREGAIVQAQLSIDGTLSIRPAQWNRIAFANELTEVRSAMPISESVMQEVRNGARY
jgi:antitoxin MazE